MGNVPFNLFIADSLQQDEFVFYSVTLLLLEFVLKFLNKAGIMRMRRNIKFHFHVKLMF